MGGIARGAIRSRDALELAVRRNPPAVVSRGSGMWTRNINNFSRRVAVLRRLRLRLCAIPSSQREPQYPRHEGAG